MQVCKCALMGTGGCNQDLGSNPWQLEWQEPVEILQGIYSIVGCGLSRNTQIKGQFKIKDNLMEKRA